MLTQLMEALPSYRHEALRAQLSLLDTAASRSFTDEWDRKAASTGDYQGLGGARATLGTGLVVAPIPPACS